MIALNKLNTSFPYGNSHHVYIYGVGGYNGLGINSDDKPIDVVIEELQESNNAIIPCPFVLNGTMPLPDTNKWTISYSSLLATSGIEVSDIEGVFYINLGFIQSHNWVDSDFQDSSGLPVYYARIANTPAAYLNTKLTNNLETVYVPFVKISSESATTTEIRENTGLFEMQVTIQESEDKTGIEIIPRDEIINWIKQHNIALYNPVIYLGIKASKMVNINLS